MSHISENLMPGEEIIHRAHLHWIDYYPVAILGIFGVQSALTGIGQLAAGNPAGILSILGLLPAGLVFGVKYLKHQKTEFAVTNRRFVGKTGILSRSTYELSLSKLEGLDIRQGIFGRFLDCGTVVVTGYGGTSKAFSRIDMPLAVRRAVYNQTDVAEANAEAPPPRRSQATPPQGNREARGDDVATQLEKLADLHEQGILTDEEFAEQKQKVLDS